MRIINFESYNKRIKKERVSFKHKCSRRERKQSHWDLLLKKNINRFKKDVTYIGNRTFRM